MSILNETVAFATLDTHVKAAFSGGTAHRTLLPAGTDLYKFTGFDAVPNKAGASYSPWWAAVTSLLDISDPGLDGHIAAAKTAGLPMLIYARNKFAVMLGWNSLGNTQSGMAKVVRIRLLQAVYGFGGRTQRQREKVDPNRVVGTVNVNKSPLKLPIFMGGAYQLYIPNLTGATVQVVGSNLIP